MHRLIITVDGRDVGRAIQVWRAYAEMFGRRQPDNLSFRVASLAILERLGDAEGRALIARQPCDPRSSDGSDEMCHEPEIA